MVPYALPAIVTLLALLVHVRRNRRLDFALLVVAVVVAALVAGLRWYADVDYEPYADLFDETPALGELDRDALLSLYGEPGYLVLSAALRSLGVPFAVLALGCAVGSLALKANVLRRASVQASLALGFYLCLHFVTIEFIQMRWAVATGFVALAFWFQFQRRPWAAVLAFGGALAFHYFSAFYWPVALVVARGGFRRYWLFLGVGFVAALLLRPSVIEGFLAADSAVWVVRRFTSYAVDPSSHIGVWSFTKLLMYPVIGGACIALRPSLPWRTDPVHLFLFRVSLATLAASLAVTFIPMLHFRATVVADFFAIVWMLYVLDHALAPTARTAAYATLALLYCLWYVQDVANYIAAGRLYEYRSWLPVYL